MKQVWEDKKLKISKGSFEKPSKKIEVEMDCSKWDKEVEDVPDFDTDSDRDKEKEPEDEGDGDSCP